MEECTVTSEHMITALGMSSYAIGCDHRQLAVVTVSMVDRTVFVTLMLENKNVAWRWHDGYVTTREEILR